MIRLLTEIYIKYDILMIYIDINIDNISNT